MAYSDVVFGKGHSFDLVVTEEGLAEIARWETCQLKPYKDKHRSGFKWAIGYGHVEGGDVEPIIITPDMEITREQAWEILRADAEKKAKWLRENITVPVTTPMFNALLSLVFNVGQGNLAKGRVLTFLNEEKYIGACAAFLDHRFAWEKDAAGTPQRVEKNGLICRRMTEGALFMTKKD